MSCRVDCKFQMASFNYHRWSVDYNSRWSHAMMVDDRGPRPPPRFGISRQNRSRFPFSSGTGSCCYYDVWVRPIWCLFIDSTPRWGLSKFVLFICRCRRLPPPPRFRISLASQPTILEINFTSALLSGTGTKKPGGKKRFVVTGSSRKNRFFVADPGTAAGSSSHGFQVGKFSDRSTFWRSGDVRLVAMKVYGIFSLLYGMTLES